jgi:hypothetical protein
MELINLDVYPVAFVDVPIRRGAFGPTITVVDEAPYTLDAHWDEERGRLEPHVWFVGPTHVRVFQTRGSHRRIVVVGRRVEGQRGDWTPALWPCSQLGRLS